MAGNIDTLKAALQVEVDGIADAVDKAEAQVLLDRYAAALTAQSELESGAVQSYTIAGRQVTRRNPQEGAGAIAGLRSQLYCYIRGQTRITQGGCL